VLVAWGSVRRKFNLIRIPYAVNAMPFRFQCPLILALFPEHKRNPSATVASVRLQLGENRVSRGLPPSFTLINILY